MKRVTSIFLAVTLGAFAMGIGVVPFLVLANQDRDRLAEERKEAETKAEINEIEKNRIAEEADQKVREANDEIARAQEILRETGEDQSIILSAQRIEESVYPKTGWKSVVSLPQGVEILIPPKTSDVQNDSEQLLIEEKDTNAIPRFSFFIEPYSKEREESILTTFTSSTEVAYVVQDHLLRGWKGTLNALNGNGEAVLLRVRENATSTHLVSINDPKLVKTSFETILGRIRFR